MKIRHHARLSLVLVVALLSAATTLLSVQNLPPKQPLQNAFLNTYLQPLHPVIPVALSATPIPTPIPTPVPTANPNNANVKAHILMYHYVRNVDANADPLGYRLSVHENELDNQIQLLQSLGYHTMTMADLAAGKGDSRSVVMTFDDGYEDFYTTAYPIFKKYGWTATLYIITNKIGGNYMTWDQIRELQAAGFEIGDHTLDHFALNTLSVEQQRHQIIDSKHDLEQQLGRPVTAFCYPSGRYNADTIQIVKDAGYTSATTTVPGLVRVGSDPFLYQRVRMNPDMSQSELLHLFL